MAYSYHSLNIIIISCILGLIVEAVCWLTIYRTKAYTRLIADIERIQKKVDDNKNNTKLHANSKKTKQEQKKEQLMKSYAGDIARIQITRTIITGATLLIFYNILSQFYDGIIVAKLPFEPPQLLQGISHRNLPGLDLTDCSMAFIYTLCSTSVRNNLIRFLGLGPAKAIMKFKLFDKMSDQIKKM